MKKPEIIAIILFSIALCLQSFGKKNCNNKVVIEQLCEAPRVLEKPGKIYFYGEYIFLNENKKGVHVINNNDPGQPIIEAFINIPGNVDIAIKDDIMYADNYTDLLVIDISNPINPVLKTRVVDAFPDYHFYAVTLKVTAINNSTGKGGSMARFTIAGDYLYTVNHYDLNVFSLKDANNPSFVNKINLGWGIETIYPYKDNLFIGSETGMYIYSIKDGGNLQKQGTFNHARACDPVVVKDNYAYVTLRGGTRCRGINNQLDIIDVRNIYKPILKKTIPMDGPYGLAITAKDVLYVCDGKSGLRVFDAKNPLQLNQLQHIEGMQTYDVIALENEVIMVIGPNGLYQYDAANKNKLKELSLIPVQTSYKNKTP